MWNWIAQNKEWLFSGAGLTALGILLWFIKRYFQSMGQPASNSVTQAPINSVTQSPVIHVNVSQGSLLLEETKKESPLIPPAPATFHRAPTKKEEDGSPILYSLPPRIGFVSEKESSGLIDGGDFLKAVIATFRMKKPSASGQGTYITARLSYRTTTDIGLRNIEKEIHRVNYGTWIDEEFNFVEMTLADTKELILILHANEKCVAVQDNRHSVNKYNGLSYDELMPDDDAFFVDVTLVDSSHGALITYSYKIETDPLKVHEIILVPRTGY